MPTLLRANVIPRSARPPGSRRRPASRIPASFGEHEPVDDEGREREEDPYVQALQQWIAPTTVEIRGVDDVVEIGFDLTRLLHRPTGAEKITSRPRSRSS